jgi:hypothetical protein
MKIRKNNITKSKKIIFSPTNRMIEESSDMPKPSTNHIPQWYRDQKLFSNKTNNFLEAYNSGDYYGTYKLCVPFVDTMTSGYIITLDCDVIVTNVANNDIGYIPEITWMSMLQPLDNPDGKRIKSIGNYPVPVGYSPLLFRWGCKWKIKTPRGYSLWVTHPSHRHDLPFFTINGFVDTDQHQNQLNFPFFIRKGFEGIIEKGTPVAQILPIKRDNWKSEKAKYIQQEVENSFYRLKQYAVRSYKKQWWTRKFYQ